MGFQALTIWNYWYKVWIYKGEVFDKDVEKQKIEKVKNATTGRN